MKVFEFHTAVDEILGRIFSGVPKDMQPCCRVGCSHCCSEPVYCDEQEADYVLAALTDDQRERVKERLPLWLERVRELLKQDMPSATDWRNVNAPCPLLERGLCIVYERRPYSCRAFFALGNPDDCRMPARVHQKFADFPHPGPLDVASMAYFNASQDGIRLDNLGVFLAEKLLGEKVESGSTQQVKFV